MPAPIHLLLIAIAAGALFLAVAALILASRKIRAKGPMPQPEDAGCIWSEVDVLDSMDAAFNALLLREGEEQPRTSPRSVLAEFYDDKACVLCGEELSVEVGQHRRALLSPEGVTVEWADLRVEEISRVRQTHQPLCWECHVIETLYRMHSGHVVTEREPQKPTRK